MAIQVLIVSDQPILRKGLSALLESAGVHIIGGAFDSQEAVRLAQARRPDVVVLDQGGPSFSDMAVMKRILQASAATKVILLTERGEDQDVLPALQAGVSGYVLKADAADLAEAIQEVSRGMTYLSRSVTSAVVKAYLTQAQPDAEHTGKPGSPDHPSPVGEMSPAEMTRTEPASTGQRRLAAIMFTDMVGYSALTHTNEALALELLKLHNDLLRRCFAERGGREIKTMGDGFLVVFANVLDAVHCAVAIQSAIHERNAVEPPGRAFQVRIGVHVGDVVHRGDDVLGNGVNVASRLEHLVRPGGICVSEQVADLARNMFGLPMIRRRGKAELKNIRTPLVVYYVRLPWEERQAPSFARASLSFLQRRTQPVADLTSLIFIVTVAGLGIWQSAVEHKTFHAMVWFGENPSVETRFLDKSRPATLSLTGAAPNRHSTASSIEAPIANLVAGSASSRDRLLPAADQGVEVMPPVQPFQAPDLLTLMVRRDSGKTSHYARHYDHVSKQLRKRSESGLALHAVFVQGRQVSAQRTMFEEAFAGTKRPPETPVAR